MYAAEGYLLDELTDAERDGFEKHFADCESCFADVRDGVRFIHALPEAVKREEKGKGRDRRWPSLAAAAVVAMAVMGGALEVGVIQPMAARIQHLQQPPLLVETPIDGRGGPAEPPAAYQPLIFKFALPPEARGPYTCSLADAHGKALSKPLAVADAGDTLNCSIPGLPAGDYELRVKDAENHAWTKAFQVR